MGNFREAGDLILTIKIEDKTFQENVIVKDPNSANSLQNAEDIKKAEEEAKKQLDTISSQLKDLNAKYKALELDLENKTSNNYDVSDISLNDLKAFLRDTQSYIIQKDVEKAQADLVLAQNEYDDLIDKLSRAKMIQKTFSGWLKDNAAIISAILASLVAFFTLYEILKKKKEHLYEKIKEMKINKDTRVVLEKKVKSKKSKKEVSEEKKE
jgi:multidrug resistance efflux pump